LLDFLTSFAISLDLFEHSISFFDRIVGCDLFGGLVKSVQRGSVNLLNSLGFHFLVFFFFLRFFHARDFAHKGRIELFDGRSVDFMFVKFFSLIKSGIDVFVIEVLELLLVGLGFQFVFRVALVVAELGSLSE
jgi:hypothetical protein